VLEDSTLTTKLVREVAMRQSRWARAVVAVAIAVPAALFVGTAAAGAGTQPIGPNQHFLGLVNGKNVGAVVFTVCGGPVSLGRTGPPAGGQHLSVAQIASGGGYTASANTVFAQFSSDPAHVFVFHDYGTDEALPPTLKVPCDGTGTVTFSPCFDTLPCPVGARADVVSVRFIDLAV
jgi:hypothetical protein